MCIGFNSLSVLVSITLLLNEEGLFQPRRAVDQSYRFDSIFSVYKAIYLSVPVQGDLSFFLTTRSSSSWTNLWRAIHGERVSIRISSYRSALGNFGILRQQVRTHRGALSPAFQTEESLFKDNGGFALLRAYAQPSRRARARLRYDAMYLLNV